MGDYMKQLSLRILEIDLSENIIEVIELPHKWVREYIGGRGLGTR